MPEVTIRTSFGSIHFTYEDDASLQVALGQLPQTIAAIHETVRPLVPKEHRIPKPGFELTYRFLSDGKLELLHWPKAALQTVALALYAYHPETVRADLIESATGITDVGAKVLFQTKNKQYFRKDGDAVGLSSEGISYVLDSIAPSLPRPAEESAGEET